MDRNPPATLSITHISSCSDFGAEFDLGESGESAPDDNISGWRIGRPGQVATNRASLVSRMRGFQGDIVDCQRR